MIGQSSMTCQIDGRWNGFPPLCLAPCPDPGIPRHGVRLGDKLNHGQTVRFMCIGRPISGTPSISCHNGVWSSDPPVCGKEGCFKPRLSPNGYVTPSKDFYNDKETVWMGCYRDYVRVGDSLSTCRNRKWTNDPPSCKRNCSNPGSPYHGWPVGREYLEGKQVSFRCQNGYDLIGLPSITCLNTGRWSGSIPQCRRRCSYRSPANSRPYSNTPITPTLKHGATIDHHCIKDYTLVGKKIITCNDGRWQPSIPTCKAPCADPGLISHGNQVSIVTSSFLHGSSVHYICDNGYTLDNPGPLTCDDGRWRKKVPSCKKTCVNPGFPQNGERTGNKFQHNSNVAYTCNRGTKLIGSSSARCIDGTWSSPLPKCLDCVMVGSVVLARWTDSYFGGGIYYRAYVRTINRSTAVLEIEDKNESDQLFKIVSKRDLVLDVPNKDFLNLPTGSRVLMPHNARYYTGAILQKRQANYLVDPDNSQLRTKWIKKKDIRVLIQEQLCE